MNRPAISNRCQCFDRALAVVAARVVFGAWFVYLGLEKALHPVDFLKIVHQYPLLHTAPQANLAAALVPWFEVFCGILLFSGRAVRGAALVTALLLLVFTALILQRALTLHAAGGVPFCSIRFDCGCGGGGGEIPVFLKLLENILLLLVSVGLVIIGDSPSCRIPPQKDEVVP